MNLKVYVRTALRLIYTKICSARVSQMRPNVVLDPIHFYCMEKKSKDILSRKKEMHRGLE